MRTKYDPAQVAENIKRERAEQERQRQLAVVVARVVDAAPPLTEDQRARLRLLLAGDMRGDL